jgi:hypothetical protein
VNTLNNPNFLKTASLAVVASIGFSACAGNAEAPDLDKSPADRYAYDYLDFDNGVYCLEDSAYDTTAGGNGRASVTPPSTTFNSETGILTITPVSGQNLLHLEGFDQTDHRVTPVGPEDQAIFDSYGCESLGYK